MSAPTDQPLASKAPGVDPARRRLLLAGALAPLAGCATPNYIAGPPQPVAPPRVQVGERWRYETINRYNNTPTGGLVATVREAGPGGLRIGLTNLAGAPLGDELYADPWRVVQDLSYDMLQLYAAPMPMIPSRLEAGAAESASTTFQVPGSSNRFYWSQWLKAPGWERIRVPAGEFLCLRVQRIIQFRHSDIFRDRPERIDTLWYAPEVNRWVQREWTGYYYWPGNPPARVQEDWVTTRLLDHTTAPTS